MDVLRTPDDRFADLPNWPYVPRYADIDGLRVHYIGQAHVVLRDAGHFLQEDVGEELARVVVEFIARTRV
jgi:hypothetical protein